MVENTSILSALLYTQDFMLSQKLSKKYWSKLKETILNTCKFSNYDINRLFCYLKKVVYSYDYTDDSNELNENLLPEKEDFYGQLNMKDVTVVDDT